MISQRKRKRGELEWAYFLRSKGIEDRSGVPIDIGAYELQISTNPVTIASLSMTASTQGIFAVNFTENALPSFSAYATTNLMMPFASWTWLGTVPQSPPGSGQFSFTLPAYTNQPQYFIGIQSP